MDIFTVEFFHKAYFSNKNSSVEDFSSILGVSPEELKAFVSIHYNLSFTDLVNRSRVQIFVDLIQNSDNENLTIEGLSVMAGFGTRQNFHKAFKKFHGGNPSDLLKAVQ
jgi:AraC-like DNA-binding protein